MWALEFWALRPRLARPVAWLEAQLWTKFKQQISETPNFRENRDRARVLLCTTHHAPHTVHDTPHHARNKSFGLRACTAL